MFMLFSYSALPFLHIWWVTWPFHLVSLQKICCSPNFFLWVGKQNIPSHELFSRCHFMEVLISDGKSIFVTSYICVTSRFRYSCSSWDVTELMISAYIQQTRDLWGGSGVLTCWYWCVYMHCAQLYLFRSMKCDKTSSWNRSSRIHLQKKIWKDLKKSPFKYLTFSKRFGWNFLIE